MHSQTLFSILATALVSNALVMHPIKRNGDQPCPLKDSTTQAIFGADKQEWTDTCPKNSDFSKDGDDCGPVKVDNTCAAYCEESTAWFYGREIKYNVSPCHADTKCSIALTDTVTVTNAYSVNVGVKGIGFAVEALNAGFSYTYSVAEASAQAITQTQSDNFCGYWTFLPFYWASWGTLSGKEFKKSRIAGYMGADTYKEECKGDLKTEKVYNYKPVFSSDGVALGETVFVKTNCETGKKLCKVHQKPSYAKQTEPSTDDSKKGWVYEDAEDCSDEAGSDGAPVDGNPNVKPTPTSAPAVPTSVGKACTDNSQCDAGMICNAGACAENTWKPTAAAKA